MVLSRSPSAFVRYGAPDGSDLPTFCARVRCAEFGAQMTGARGQPFVER